MESRVLREIEKFCKISDQKNDDSAFMVLDIDNVVEKVKLWREEMPRIQPYYAMKCNSDPMLLGTLAALDIGFDCASKVELETIVNLGVPANLIVYANTCKAPSHLRYAASSNIELMTFDNEEEILKIKRIFPSAKLILRLNVKASNAIMPMVEKFGCEEAEVPGLLDAALQHNLSVVGVSFHVGGFNQDPIDYVNSLKMCRRVFDIAKKKGIRMYLVDIGGGFPGIRNSGDPRKIHFTKITRTINQALDEYFPSDGSYEIIAEPGRYFAMTAFTLCTNVIGKKKRLVDNEEDTMYTINEGIYGLFLHVVMYDVKPVLSEIPPSSKGKRSSIWGQSCDPKDVIFKKCMMPNLKIGDWIMFEEMGAYTYACSTTFNGFEKTGIKAVISEKAKFELENIAASKLRRKLQI